MRLKIGICLTLVCVLLSFSTVLFAKARVRQPSKAELAKIQKAKAADTTKVTPKPKGIAAIIKPSAKKKSGLMTVYIQDEKYYFLIPTALLGQDMMLVNRITKSAAGVREFMVGYAGDQINSSMIRLSESPNKKSLFIHALQTRELIRDSSQMNTLVERSNLQPISLVLPIVATNLAKDSILVDATLFLSSDNTLNSFSPSMKTVLSIAGFQPDKSYVTEINSYPMNLEMRSVKSYMIQKKSPFASLNSPPAPSYIATFEINNSLVMLPKVPMQPRYYDRRIGYFTERYVDFDKDPQGVKNMEMVTRYRLEPKPEDMERYRAGELVEPIKPIIYYIDTATPAKWVPYLIQGVNDWQASFEKAGFKNAIEGRVAPTHEQDSTWSLEDARYSAIVYKPSTISNASGPHVHDPRSGEILEAHVNWFHNIQLLLRNWYMIQAGPNDVDGQKMVFSDELMGQLIRFVSAHEVGHTIGLRHNFGATSSTPVDSLRSECYLFRCGHSASIMDYSRMNYVAQPEDNIKPELLLPRIQEYDHWAIEWGYRLLPEFNSATDELPYMNQWVIRRNAENPRLWFGTESNTDDPRSQNEDLGDDQMRANELGIRNLKRVIQGLPQWTATPDQDYSDLEMMYREVVGQYIRYVGHVAKWVGGIYENPKTIEQGGVVYSFVEKKRQQQAMKWLNDQLFKTPTWLIDKELFAKTGFDQTEIFNAIYLDALTRLMSPRVIQNLFAAEVANGKDAYTVNQYFADLNMYVWTELGSGKSPDSQRRLLQKNYVAALVLHISGSSSSLSRLTTGDRTATILFQLRQLNTKLNSAAINSSDPVVKAHYQYLASEIKKILEPK